MSLPMCVQSELTSVFPLCSAYILLTYPCVPAKRVPTQDSHPSGDPSQHAYVPLTFSLHSAYVALCPAVYWVPLRDVRPSGDPYSCAYVLLTCFLRAAYVPLCTLVSWVPVPGRPSFQGTLTGVLTCPVCSRETRRGALRAGGGPGKGVFLPHSLEPGRAPVTA